MCNTIYPFTAIVGQEDLKLALLLNAVNPLVGGLLVRGEKGTAKSTAVRALAAVLPEIEVFVACPYGCDPALPNERCDACRARDNGNRSVSRPIPVVTLPLNATEDRLVGGIDFSATMKTGRRSLQPGLLAKAHRGILYVDEVNLLDDHLVDVILDAAASGENIIEREGISCRHACRFILVGTMNPEEGELRPQLLDRFGLCVEVAAEGDKDDRVELMQRREAYDADPEGFIAAFRQENEDLTAQVRRSRETVAAVRVPGRLRTFISELCTENHVAGHRADLVMEQAAKAHAAFRQRHEVADEDIIRVAPLALAHRRREASPAPPPPPEPERNDAPDETEVDNDDQRSEDGGNTRPEQAESQGEEQPRSADEAPSEPTDPQDAGTPGPEPPEQVFEVGATFKVKRISSPKDRLFRRGSGRRSRTRTSRKQGRYVKSIQRCRTGDLALDATLRAAAPHQRRRGKANGLAVHLREEDIHEKIREKRMGNFLLFLVDASGSMGARGRMVASKGAVMSLLLDAYQKRDRVALISFRKQDAMVNLPPTSSVELAGRLLEEMPVGGRTPLSSGLAKAYEVIRSQLLKDPALRPIVILVTDGKTNVALGGGPPMEEALTLGTRMAADGRIRFVVVDTEEQGLINFGLAAQMAGALEAGYFKVEDLKANQLLEIARGTEA